MYILLKMLFTALETLLTLTSLEYFIVIHKSYPFLKYIAYRYKEIYGMRNLSAR